jgi:hypothetical protein
MTEQAKTVYVVVSKCAKMPRSCGGVYHRVGVVEIIVGSSMPKMLSERAKGVVRVVRTWEKLRGGSTKRCAHERALAEAEALADRLNGFDCPYGRSRCIVGQPCSACTDS